MFWQGDCQVVWYDHRDVLTCSPLTTAADGFVMIASKRGVPGDTCSRPCGTWHVACCFDAAKVQGRKWGGLPDVRHSWSSALHVGPTLASEFVLTNHSCRHWKWSNYHDVHLYFESWFHTCKDQSAVIGHGNNLKWVVRILSTNTTSETEKVWTAHRTSNSAELVCENRCFYIIFPTLFVRTRFQSQNEYMLKLWENVRSTESSPQKWKQTHWQSGVEICVCLKTEK